MKYLIIIISLLFCSCCNLFLSKDLEYEKQYCATHCKQRLLDPIAYDYHRGIFYCYCKPSGRCPE